MIAIPNMEKPEYCRVCHERLKCKQYDGEILHTPDDCPLIEIPQEDEKAVLFLLRMRKAMREGKSWREFLDEERRNNE